MANEEVHELLEAADKLCFLPDPAGDGGSNGLVTRYGLTFNSDQDLESFRTVIHYLSLVDESDGIQMQPIRDIVVKILIRTKTKDGAIGKQDVATYIRECRSVKPSAHYVVRELHGVILQRHLVPFRFGDFTIYQWDLHKEVLRNMAGPRGTQDWPKDSYKHLIGCSVQARNVKQARDLADQQFAKLENAIRFMDGTYKSVHDVTVVAPHRMSIENSFVFSDDYNSVQTEVVGFAQNLRIDHAFFRDPEKGYDRLLSFLHSPTNDLQGKIVRSVEWIGQALNDRNLSSAMVKAATALEVLLSRREPGPVTPGIVAQVAETAAQLLAEAPEHGPKIEADVRRLYTIRSKIVHSGIDTVELKELKELIKLVTQAVQVLLTHHEFSKFATMEALGKELNIRKYAWTRKPEPTEPVVPGAQMTKEDQMKAAIDRRRQWPVQRYSFQMFPEEDRANGPYETTPGPETLAAPPPQAGTAVDDKAQ